MMKLWYACALLTTLALQGCGGTKPDKQPDTPVVPTAPTCEQSCGNFDYKKGDYQQCIICEHVYDERDGCLQCTSDFSKPCTTEKDCTSKKFEDLPDDWLCPVCRNPKSKYQKVTVGADVKWVDFDGTDEAAQDGYTPAGGACKPIGGDGKLIATPTQGETDFCHACMVDKCAVSTPAVVPVNAPAETCGKDCGNVAYPKGDYQQCTVCEHVYDERDGCIQCPKDFSKPCTTEKGCTSKKFEDLPDDWVCPVCRNPKSKYQKVTVGDTVQWVDFEADGYTPAGGACKPVGGDGKVLPTPTQKQTDFCNSCTVDKCAVAKPAANLRPVESVTIV